MTAAPAEEPRVGRWARRASQHSRRTSFRSPGPAARLVVATGAALTAQQAFRRLRAHPGADADRWSRTNHRGEQVSLLLGPAAVAGTIAATMAMPGLTPAERLAAATAVLGSGAVGAYDDLAGTSATKGLHGHMDALRRGQVTTGVVKVAGIGASGLLAAALLGRSGRPGRSGRSGRSGGPWPGVATILADGALVAASANLVNLLDLRPGRALKVVLLHAPMLLTSAGPALAAPVGVAAGLLADDLSENGMLGDCGANALGAGLGVAVAARLPRPARLAVLAGLVGLILASERVSFTAVIERHAPLRRLDELGRRLPRR